jgi:hypothetical protein
MNIDSLARKEVEAALEKTKKVLVKSHEIIVQNWKSDVGFRAAKYIRKDRMWVTVFPVGADREIWFYVDLGTKPHDIPERVPKNAKALAFRAGGKYNPKTLASPARVASGGGTVTGGTKVVVSPSFKSEVENAFRRVANAGG